MVLFHMVLTLECPHCGEKLVRVAPSEYLDLAICPGCLAFGSYDQVVEGEAELASEPSLPGEVAEFMRGLHPG